MKRSELEHIVRAAGSIADDSEIIVIGSQSILGQFPNAPSTLLASSEADVYPRNRPELAELIDGSIGEGSAFHELYGYYAQGVGEDTAVLPKGWRDRLVRMNDPNSVGITGLCLEVHDLAVSKYIAGREKDLEFTRELAMHRMTDREILLARLPETEISEALRALVFGRIERDFAGRRSVRAGSGRSRKRNTDESR
jgi:Nucleotidyltransferase of unknown function (DUF6036)